MIAFIIETIESSENSSIDSSVKLPSRSFRVRYLSFTFASGTPLKSKLSSSSNKSEKVENLEENEKNN